MKSPVWVARAQPWTGVMFNIATVMTPACSWETVAMTTTKRKVYKLRWQLLHFNVLILI